MVDSKQVAEYFLSLAEPEIGDTISNLKLQKLLYYAQGFHLAMFEEKLFEDQILAWEHGPVVEKLYHEYKKYGGGAILVAEETQLLFENLSIRQRDLLREVYEVYGQFSAWKLRNMTHSERPWSETPMNKVISTEAMKDFFKQYLIPNRGN